MNLHKKLLCTAGVALLLSSTTLFAAEQSAKDVANKAYQYIGSMDKYSFNAVVSAEEAQDGIIANTYRQNVSVKVVRPGKLRVDSKGDVKNRSSYINEGTFTMLDRKFGYYGQIETKKDIDGTLDMIFETYGIKAPLASLIYSDMDKRVKFNRSKYFGVVDVAGVECDYVAFKSKVREVHVWISTGDQPLVKTFSIIDTSIKGNPRRNTTLTWNTDPKISESDFVFSAPKDVTQISIEPAN